MSLITATRLKMAVNNCPDVLKRIAQKINSPEFEQAAFAFDTKKADELLDNAVFALLGDDYIIGGLEDYLAKFDIKEDLSKLGNIGIILKIHEHRDEIDRKLKSAGL